MQDNSAASDLVRLSRALGENPAYVQGGGGNTSIKTNSGQMLVKASGTRLGEMTDDSGYVAIDPKRVASLLDDTEESENIFNAMLCAAALGSGGAQPSMETGFHSVLGKVVAHTHSVYANVLACAEEGPELAQRICPEAGWIPYCSPGLALSRAVEDAVGHDVFILQNHGLIVSGDSAAEVEARHTLINRSLRAGLHLERDFNMHPPVEPIAEIRRKVLFPDQVVVFGADDMLLGTRAATEILAAWAYIYEEIGKAQLTPRFLPVTENGVLMSMDAEKNRQVLTK